MRRDRRETRCRTQPLQSRPTLACIAAASDQLRSCGVQFDKIANADTVNHNTVDVLFLNGCSRCSCSAFDCCKTCTGGDVLPYYKCLKTSVGKIRLCFGDPRAGRFRNALQAVGFRRSTWHKRYPARGGAV
jgi:hypothetical protein